jgi:hypothetical protein
MKQAAKEMNEGLYVLTHEQASEYLRMQHALVYASIQGRTMRDKHVAILDWHRQGWSIRTLIVAMSRATHGKFVHIFMRTRRGTSSTCTGRPKHACVTKKIFYK